MCIIAEELENRGIEKGIQEGTRTKAENVAKNMFDRNMSAEDTAAICEESLEQIQEWFKGWRK